MKNEKKYTAPEITELNVRATDIIATSSGEEPAGLALYIPDVLAGEGAYKPEW